MRSKYATSVLCSPLSHSYFVLDGFVVDYVRELCCLVLGNAVYTPNLNTQGLVLRIIKKTLE